MIYNLLGVDLGGSKFTIKYGIKDNEQLKVVDKLQVATTNVTDTIDAIINLVDTIMLRHHLTKENTEAIGVSCGGPLNSKEGIILSPPNLPGWDNIPIVDILYKCFEIKTNIQNDANACALAEWQFGSGRGYNNLIFLTFGTGLGAGLILDGKLYTGTNDSAGEVGHIRLSDYGPVGYGKTGSFEGFCSGGGIAQLAKICLLEKVQMGEAVSWCKKENINNVTAKMVAEAAQAGDKLALDIFKATSIFLGKGLSVIIDLLNPEVIIIGSIYTRNESLMKPYVSEIIAHEALSLSSKVCTIRTAALGENIGDYASLSVAANLIKGTNDKYYKT